MSIQNVGEFLDGLAKASIGTWISVFLGLVAMLVFGFWVAVKLTPKNEAAEDIGTVSAKKEPIQPPVPTRGNGT